MKQVILIFSLWLSIFILPAFGQYTDEQVGISPWGAEDEIGTLNRMNEASRLSILSQVSSGTV